MQITQDLKNKISPEHPFVNISKWKTCKILAENSQLYDCLSSSKFSVFADKIPGFSKTIELCLNFCVGFCLN